MNVDVHGEILAQNKTQEAPQHKETEHTEHLKALQSWGPAEGEELAVHKQDFTNDIIDFQTAYRERLVKEMSSLAPHAPVKAAAPTSQNPAAVPAAKESYKAKRARTKKAKAAEKVCPGGDEHSFEISGAITGEVESRKLLYKDEELVHLLQERRYDKRVADAFRLPFSVNKAGEAASERDRELLEQNRHDIRAYATGNPLLRRPFLDRAKNEMLALNFSMKPDMFTKETFARRAGDYKRISDKFYYFENLQKENPEYFNNLPPLEAALLEAQTQMAIAFSDAFVKAMGGRGISNNSGEFRDVDDIDTVMEFRKDAETAEEVYTESLKTMNVNMQKAFNSEVERLIPLTEPDFAGAYLEQDKLFKETYGVSFPSGTSEQHYAEMVKFRNMILENPEKYEENKALIDQLYSDLYKIFSQWGEELLRQHKMSAISMDYSDGPGGDPIRRGILVAAMRLVDESTSKTALLEAYVNGLGDLLKHFLKGLPLSDGAKVTLTRYTETAPGAGNEGEG